MFKRLADFPPVVCRILARVKGKGWACRPLTSQEISDASGLPLELVEKLSREVSWDEYTLKTVKAFVKGCNLDLEDAKVARSERSMYKRSQFSYLTKTRDTSRLHLYAELLDIAANLPTKSNE